LQGHEKIKFNVRKPGGTPDYNDPHALQGIYSFNFFAASLVLEPEKLARVVHVAK
jgi:hypothetical protein